MEWFIRFWCKIYLESNWETQIKGLKSVHASWSGNSNSKNLSKEDNKDLCGRVLKDSEVPLFMFSLPWRTPISAKIVWSHSPPWEGDQRETLSFQPANSHSELFEPQECYLWSISFSLQIKEKEKGKSV